MSWYSRPSAWGAGGGVGALLALAPALLAAQQRSAGWHETALGAVALASRPAVFALSGGASWRDRGGTRIGFAVAAGGTGDGRFAERGELAYHFLLDAARSSGWGVYGGGGLALGIVEDDRARPWVLAVIGAESRPGGRSGWYLEAGFGGGIRAAAGYRWRK